MSIFVSLLTRVRQSLKAEAGAFFERMLLRPIEPRGQSPAVNPIHLTFEYK